jgi:spermidine synthase
MYYVVAGLTGALIMMLELVASRIMAPGVGTSLLAWTSIIAGMLTALAAGYALGGRLADATKRPLLPYLLALSGVGLLVTAYTANPLLVLLAQSISDVRIRATVAVFVLFGPATIMLGTILPYCTKRVLQTLSHAGEIVGRMYAISTIGSIIGTFLAGYVLIGIWGSTQILLGISVTLFLMAAASGLPKLALIVCLTLLSIGLSSRDRFLWPGAIADFDTLYNRVWIEDVKDGQTGRPVRFARTGPYGEQSSMFMDTHELAAPYLKFFHLASLLQPHQRRVLMLGGGALVFPMDFSVRNPHVRIDVVEIDPQFPRIAQTYFAITPGENVHVVYEDARMFLQNVQVAYDTVFVDVFEGGYTPPFHVTTREAVQRIADALSPNGIAFVNVIAATTGEKARLAEAQAATYRDVFPYVFLFAINPNTRADALQNIVLVASKSTLSEDTLTDVAWREYHARRFEPDDRVSPILTDNYAPVEWLAMSFY